ncbi:MAG TPA: Fe-S cluster assembly protein SufD [Bacteroidales bacterium]|nr:Fe-S cluster assembly protein SufD [Bacteroidales bacterium]
MAEKTTIEQLKEKLVRLYQDNKTSIDANVGEGIKSIRSKALADFEKLGIPTRKVEAYRYTNLEKVLTENYNAEFSAELFKIDLKEVFKCEIPELDTYVVLVLNGFYYHDNKITGLPEGVIITSLAQASVSYPEIFNAHYGKYVNTGEDSLAALNSFFAQDGVFIYIPEHVKIDKPVQIINLCFSFKNLRVTGRNLIVAEKGSELQVIVCDHTLCRRKYLSNSLTEIFAGAKTKIEYSKVQNENNLSAQLSNVYFHQEEDSQVVSNIVSLHGGFIRNNIFVNLSGERAENHMYGLFIGDSNQHISNYTNVNHAKPGCHSNQLFKGILNENATGAFNGKIYVSRDAQKTLAYQKNNNILLSPSAKMNSKPQLEIYADDVKCSHGATVGQLDEDALFYLRSRGIREAEARYLLMYAFANGVISNIGTRHLRDRIIDLVDKRLRGELSKCNECEIHCG